jgi:hypothetical protein
VGSHHWTGACRQTHRLPSGDEDRAGRGTTSASVAECLSRQHDHRALPNQTAVAPTAGGGTRTERKPILALMSSGSVVTHLEPGPVQPDASISRRRKPRSPGGCVRSRVRRTGASGMVTRRSVAARCGVVGGLDGAQQSLFCRAPPTGPSSMWICRQRAPALSLTRGAGRRRPASGRVAARCRGSRLRRRRCRRYVRCEAAIGRLVADDRARHPDTDWMDAAMAPSTDHTNGLCPCALTPRMEVVRHRHEIEPRLVRSASMTHQVTRRMFLAGQRVTVRRHVIAETATAAGIGCERPTLDIGRQSVAGPQSLCPSRSSTS